RLTLLTPVRPPHDAEGVVRRMERDRAWAGGPQRGSLSVVAPPGQARWRRASAWKRLTKCLILGRAKYSRYTAPGASMLARDGQRPKVHEQCPAATAKIQDRPAQTLAGKLGCARILAIGPRRDETPPKCPNARRCWNIGLL